MISIVFIAAGQPYSNPPNNESEDTFNRKTKPFLPDQDNTPVGLERFYLEMM